MADLNLDVDYFEHPKTKRLIGLLGRGAEVLPLKLWCYCGKYHAEDGRLSEYGAHEIESVMGWWGKKGDAIKAMVKVGFVDKDVGGYQVHGWAERQGHIDALRKRARNAANARWDAIRNASGNAQASPGHTPIPAIHTSHPLSAAEKTRRRLEAKIGKDASSNGTH